MGMSCSLAFALKFKEWVLAHFLNYVYTFKLGVCTVSLGVGRVKSFPSSLHLSCSLVLLCLDAYRHNLIFPGDNLLTGLEKIEPAKLKDLQK